VAVAIFGASSAVAVAKIATVICGASSAVAVAILGASSGASSAIACHRERLRV
jgi:hypothetical protein